MRSVRAAAVLLCHQNRTMNKIYSVAFRYFARNQTRFVSCAVSAAGPRAAQDKLLESVRERHACDRCTGIPTADPAQFVHRPKHRLGEPAPPCDGAVGGLAEADVRGHGRVYVICDDAPPGPAVKLKIGEKEFTYEQPGNQSNPVVLR